MDLTTQVFASEQAAHDALREMLNDAGQENAEGGYISDKTPDDMLSDIFADYLDGRAIIEKHTVGIPS